MKLTLIIIYLTVIGLVVWYAPDMAIWLTQFTLMQIGIFMIIAGAILIIVGMLFREWNKVDGLFGRGE